MGEHSRCPYALNTNGSLWNMPKSASDSLPESAASDPLLSIVLPTTGNVRNLRRCLMSILSNFSDWLRASSELLIFFNAEGSDSALDEAVVRYIDSLGDNFAKVRIVRSTKFELTAEESAWAACAHARGRYTLISGDKRIYLPEGAAILERWLKAPSAPCAYFNSLWIDPHSQTHGHASSHFSHSAGHLPYKRFVMQAGLNFIPTAMGMWVFESGRLDRVQWKTIIDTCGPHFSHVTLALSTVGDEMVAYFSSFLALVESKAYHAGDAGEWANYARLSKTYRFYAWTFGLVRQFRYLIEAGVYDYSDVRRSTCTEGRLLKRQIEEIYVHLLAQIRRGWLDRAERITHAEFEEIISFLVKVGPEKAILHELYRQAFQGYDGLTRSKFSKLVDVIARANEADHGGIPLGSLLVGQVGGKYVRLHPQGYLLSDVIDTKDFLLAYKLIDCPKQGPSWTLLDDAEFAGLKISDLPHQTCELFVPDGPNPGRGPRGLRGAFARRLWRSQIAMRIFAMLPDRLQYRAKRLLGMV